MCSLRFKVLTVVTAMSLCAGSSLAERTAKAVFDSEAKILTFYYDETDHSGDGVAVYVVPESGGRTWSEASSLTQAVFDVSFRDFKPRSMQSWLSWQGSGLTSIVGMENLNTSETVSMNSMFRYIPVVELDLSRVDWQTIKDIGAMVNSCSSLKTVYVAPDFALRPDCATATPFSYNWALVGGAGTAFSRGVTDKFEFARIDGGESAPGLFTAKEVELPPEVYSVVQTYCDESSVGIMVRGRFYQSTGTLTVRLRSGGADAFSTELHAFGEIVFAGLSPSTEYQAVVSAENDYGTVTGETLTFRTLDPPSARWFYDKSANVVSNANWRFAASPVVKGGTELNVNGVQLYPAEPAELDFSRQVVDADGVVYAIVKLAPGFGEATSASNWRPVGRSPQCARVGELTLPKSLRTIDGCSFTYCTNMTLKGGFPDSLSVIGDGAFRGASLPDEIVITNLSSLGSAAFKDTAITSVVFGPALTFIGGNYDRGAFQVCTRLTNVVFDARSDWHCTYGSVFAQCTALKTLNLQGMTNAPASLASTTVESLILPAKLVSVTSNFFANANALTNVVFEGEVPASIDTPLYSKLSKTRTITTSVSRKYLSKKNSAGMCWLDYAADGRIARKGTTWAVEYAGVDDLARRPLLDLAMQGLILFFR